MMMWLTIGQQSYSDYTGTTVTAAPGLSLGSSSNEMPDNGPFHRCYDTGFKIKTVANLIDTK